MVQRYSRGIKGMPSVTFIPISYFLWESVHHIALQILSIQVQLKYLIRWHLELAAETVVQKLSRECRRQVEMVKQCISFPIKLLFKNECFHLATSCNLIQSLYINWGTNWYRSKRKNTYLPLTSLNLLKNSITS